MTGLTLTYHGKLPSMLSAYVRMLTSRKSNRIPEGKTIPFLEASIEGLRPDLKQLALYRKVCGFSENGTLPFSFPHIMASPLFMNLVSSKQFPLKEMGIVHTSVVMNIYRPIAETEPLDIVATINGHREANRGAEFDIVLKAQVDGKLVWDSTSTYISISKKKNKSDPKPKQPAPAKADYSFEEITLAEDLGRRYAKASGDYNPIHMKPFTAKLFGFPRHIIHGMWTYAKAGALVIPEGAESFSFESKFIGPIFLPSKVSLARREPDGNGLKFKVLASASAEAKPHLLGSYKELG